MRLFFGLLLAGGWLLWLAGGCLPPPTALCEPPQSEVSGERLTSEGRAEASVDLAVEETPACAENAQEQAKESEVAPPESRPEPVAEGSPERPLPTGLFPGDWEGHWRGDLKIFQGSALVQSLVMEMEIRDRGQGKAQWKIVYQEGLQRQVRDYEIIAVDAGRGHYRIDEKNSIAIDAFVAGTTVVSRFAVTGTLLTILYRREGAFLIFEVMSGPALNPRMTGGGQGAPVVSSFTIAGYQNARLSWIGP